MLSLKSEATPDLSLALRLTERGKALSVGRIKLWTRAMRKATVDLENGDSSMYWRSRDVSVRGRMYQGCSPSGCVLVGGAVMREHLGS